jgi:signal transduction histidine kinase
VLTAAVGESRDALARGLAALSQPEGGGRPHSRFQARFLTEQGRRIELGAAPVRSSSGRPAGIYAVLRDCTEQHRYELAIRQSQKLESVGVLAAGVAHEVNNPLAFIQANLGTLQQMADAVERNLAHFPEKDARELADLRDVIDESLEGIARISRIVNRLRRFSRTAEEPVGPLDLNAVAEEAIRFARLDRQGGPAIETRLAPDLPPVHGSRDGLTQVLLNLLLNAAQAVAGRSDGRIEVTSRLEPAEDGEPPPWLVLEVRDNGPGVPETIRRHVFDPFFTTKSPDQGTGLGLAIAFDIVREHQGHLELLPDDGRGACFALRLPAAA